jgi:hypothetical protein
LYSCAEAEVSVKRVTNNVGRKNFIWCVFGV